MDPLQTSPVGPRPDLDADDVEPWAAGDRGGAPAVVVNVPETGPGPWPAGPTWAPPRPVPTAGPPAVPAWPAPALAELARILAGAATPPPAKPSYPPLPGGVRTYSPFRPR